MTMAHFSIIAAEKLSYFDHLLQISNKFHLSTFLGSWEKTFNRPLFPYMVMAAILVM